MLETKYQTQQAIFIIYSILQISITMQIQTKKGIESNNDKILQLWSMQRQIAARIENQKINQKSILLIGDTNVGKTTLLYYLSGMKLNLVQNTFKKTKQIHPETVYQDARVNNSQSTTQVPNIFSQISNIENITIIDMPGMNDTKFINALSNMFTFLTVFQKLLTKTKVHIVFVISEEIFDPIEIMANLQEIVSRFDGEGFREGRNLSIIFTKTEDDLQSVKQNFIEFIGQIREAIEDDQQEEKLVQLIDFIKDLSESNEIMYVFPKQTPEQQQGLKITQAIYERDHFVGNQQVMLNQMFVDNVLESEKTIVSEFEDNLIETIRQSFSQVSGCIKLMVGLVRFLHKKFVKVLFETETDFQTQLQSFFNTNSAIILEFSSGTTVAQFQDMLSLVCENIPENNEIFLLDKTFIAFFTGISSMQQNIEDGPSNIHYTIQLTAHLQDCFEKMHEIVSKFKETESFVGFFKQIAGLLNWLRSQWYQSLSKVKSLQSVAQILNKCEQQLNQRNELKWKQICQQTHFMDTLKAFSSKSLQKQSQEESSSQQEQQIITVEEQVADNGYYGSTVKELKKRYMSVSTVPRVDEGKGEVEKILEDERKLEVRIGEIVKSLQQQVVRQVTQAQQSGQCKLTLPPQKIAFILFQMRRLRHRIFLYSALNNFGTYLKFIYFSLILEHQQHHVLPIVQGFIQNLCLILDQYSLFEQQMVLMVFARLYGKIGKVFQRGIRGHRIGGGFITGYLFKHMQTILEKTNDSATLGQLEDVITVGYSYLISECSSSKQQAIGYQKEMAMMLKTLKAKQPNDQEKTNSELSTQGTHSTTNKPIQEPNYFALEDNSFFQLSSVVDKIQLLQQRNTNPQLYQIHYHFHPQLYRPL